MQNNVLRYQSILSRDSENNRLSGTGELSPMALGAHGSGIGSKRYSEFPADHISTSSIVGRYRDVSQS